MTPRPRQRDKSEGTRGGLADPSVCVTGRQNSDTLKQLRMCVSTDHYVDNGGMCDTTNNFWCFRGEGKSIKPLVQNNKKKVHFCSSGVIQASVSLVIQIILKKV